MKCDLSVICPSIHPQSWPQIYNSVTKLFSGSWELIFVGPHAPENQFTGTANVRWVRDFGQPSRALAIGMEIAEGEFVTYTSDDTIDATPKALDNALTLLKQNDEPTAVCVQYNEHRGFSDQPFELDYWRSHHHADLRLPNTNPDWLVFTIFLMKKSLYESLGGIDTTAEHINTNLHDAAFRFQKFGGKILISPDLVWKANFIDRSWSDPVLAAYKENDKPWLDKMWENNDRPYKITTSWKDQPAFWPRRWKLN